MRCVALCWVLIAAPCLAHDVSVDLTGAVTASSADNPRTGSVAVGASGSYDFNDRWAVTGLAVYTRDLSTRTGESFSPGSNVFLLSLGAMWLPLDSVMTMLSVNVSPPVDQLNATTVAGLPGRRTDVTIASRTSSFGAMWNGLWNSGGFSNFEQTVDVTLGFNRFSVGQRLVLPDTFAGKLLREACAENRALEVCPLVRGVASPLLQGRVGAGFTATLFTSTDLGLEATYFLYDKPPADVGYFSVVSLGREVGTGVPVLPLQLSVRGHASHRFGPVTVKVAYQFGDYIDSPAALHSVTARVSWKVTREWRVSLSMTGQLDFEGRVSNLGGQGQLGVSYAW